MVQNWPLVGRADELELVESIVAEGRHGVVLSGPAGVGKTRLATEVLSRATARGIPTAWVAATRSVATVPFGAFAPILPASLGAAESPVEVLRSAGEELARLARGGRLLIGVDDAHLLDDASAALARLLADGSTCSLLVTVRRGEPAPDPVVALWKEGLAERVELRALSAYEVSDLLTRVLGGQVDTATNLRLWEATQGNVLFLRELVLEGRDRGALAQRGGVWSWEGRLGGGTRLTELVEARLSGLATKDRRVLEELATGEPLGPAVLGGAETAAALERLEARGLVTTVEDGRRTELRLSHPLYAEALRAGMGPLRRRAVLRALAENLAATGVHRRHDILRLATWQIDGGGPVDRASLLEAARQARALFDHKLAERLARRAVDEGGSVEAALVLGDTLYWQGRHREAQEVLDGIATDAVDDEQRATSAIARSSNLFWGLGRGEEAQQLLRSTTEQVEDPGWRDELTAHWASLRLFGGDVEQARVAAESVLFRPGASERAQARALATVIPAWTLAGRPESAAMMASVVLADVVGPAGTAAEHPALVAELLQGQAIAYWLGGRLADMEQIAGEGYRAAVERAEDDFRGPWALLLGRAALARGLAATARDRLREAAALLRRQDVGGFLPWCLAAGAQAFAVLGDVSAAEQALAEARRCRLASVRIHDVEFVLADAWVKAAAGEVSAAAALGVEAADVAAAAGMGIVEVMALHESMRLGGGVEVARRLVERAAPLEGALAPALADHARAVLAGDAGDLDRAADAFVALGMPLLAAEAAASAADLHRAGGRASSQLAALSRSRSLAETCEGARTPALLRAAQAPDLHWLTRREREVVELAARSLTKREIADRLVVSIRTVGNHLNHAYAKLGVSSREDLDRLVGLGDGAPPGPVSSRG